MYVSLADGLALRALVKAATFARRRSLNAATRRDIRGFGDPKVFGDAPDTGGVEGDHMVSERAGVRGT